MAKVGIAARRCVLPLLLTDGVEGITARQGQNRRNIVPFVRFRSDGHVLVPADATVAASKLVALGARCHRALTGVLFESHKSRLTPESDSVLTPVSAMMAAGRALRLEGQGPYRQFRLGRIHKPLSEARAQSVPGGAEAARRNAGPADGARLWQDSADCDQPHGPRARVEPAGRFRSPRAKVGQRRTIPIPRRWRPGEGSRSHDGHSTLPTRAINQAAPASIT